MMRFTRHGRDCRMRELVEEACHMISTQREVRSIHIVGQTRPDYALMSKYRAEAQNTHVRLIVDGLGTVTIRPDEQKDGQAWR